MIVPKAWRRPFSCRSQILLEGLGRDADNIAELDGLDAAILRPSMRELWASKVLGEMELVGNSPVVEDDAAHGTQR